MNTQEKVTQEEFDKAYKLHQQWLSDENTGERMEFSDKDLTKVLFPNNCNLRRANLARANLTQVNLFRINLSQASLFEINLTEAYLEFADLQEARLEFANLFNANLEDANLDSAILIGANLTRANLAGVYLAGANLFEANLSRANLSETNLSRANLTRVNLTRVNLAGANLRGTILEKKVSSEYESSEKIKQEYQEAIRKLESEKISLIEQGESSANELKEKEEQLNKLREERKRIEDKQKEESQTKALITNINNSFDKLDEKAAADLKDEICRLEELKRLFIYASYGCAVLLIVLWGCFFWTTSEHMVNGILQMDVKTILSKISPSALLVTFIVLSVIQVNKYQRHIISIREFLYKPQLIRSNLNAIFTVNGDKDIEKSKEKVTTILEEWSLGLIRSSKSLEQLENDVKTIDNKEKAPNDQVLSLVKELIKKM